MKIMFLTGVKFSIEFLKLYIVVTALFGFRLKQWLPKIFIAGLVCIVIAAARIDLFDQYAIFFCMLAVAIISAALEDRTKLGWVFISDMIIAVIDIVIGIIVCSIMDINMGMLDENPIYNVLINSISVIIILMVSILRKNKLMNVMKKENMLLFAAGALSLLLYLTAVFMLELGAEDYGWGGVSAVVLTGVVTIVFYMFVLNQNENRRLQYENSITQSLLTSQHEYFLMLLKKERETKAFRHDIKEHIVCMAGLCRKEKYEDLYKYLIDLEDAVTTLLPAHVTGNAYFDIIINDMERRYPDVDIDWIGHVPLLNMSETDICSLLYNLLKNACEAASETNEKKVQVRIMIEKTTLIVKMSNQYKNINRMTNGTFVSIKKGQDNGFGLYNIEKCVKKYKGMKKIKLEDNRFIIEIIIPDVIKHDEDFDKRY